MINWPRTPLREVTTKIGSGATPRGGKGVYQDTGVALIRSQNVYDHRFDATGIARITDEAADALAGVTVQARDVLVNITGESVTRTCSVDPNVLPARVSQHVAIVRARKDLLDPTFLRYSLLNPPVKKYLNTISEAGATRRALTKADLESLEVALPPLPEQRLIVGVLGAFDDLIETNMRLVSSLDDLGRVVVQALAKDLTRRVPLVDACATIESGRRPKGGVKGIQRGVPSLGAESVNRMTPFDFGKTKYVPEEFARAMRRGVLEDMDVLVYKDGGKPGEFFPDVSMVGCGYPFTEMVINEHVFRVRANAPLGQGFLYFWLSTDEMMGLMKEAGSRTAAIPGINSTNFGALPVPIPGPEDCASTMPVLDEVATGALTLLAECRDLACQRDELLPLLMSGKVRVSELEGVA